MKPLATAEGCQASVAFSADESLVACGGDSNDEVMVLRLPRLDPVADLKAGGDSSVASIVFVPGAAPGRLAVGYFDGAIRLWSLSDRRIVTTLSGHREGVYALAASADGSLLVSGAGAPLNNRVSADNSVRLWSMPDGKLMRTITEHRFPVTAVAISPSGSLVASASRGGEVFVDSRLAGSAAPQDVGTPLALGARLTVTYPERTKAEVDEHGLPTFLRSRLTEYESLTFSDEHTLVSGSDDFVGVWSLR